MAGSYLIAVPIELWNCCPGDLSLPYVERASTIPNAIRKAIRETIFFIAGLIVIIKANFMPEF